MPLELITMLGGFLLTAVGKLISLKMKMSQHRHQMLMEKIGARTKAVNDAREWDAPGYSFTRRTIALLSVASIIVLPIVATAFNPDLFINYGFAEAIGGGWFTQSHDALVWATGTGITIGPIHTHLVYAIAGMYFGSSSVK